MWSASADRDVVAIGDYIAGDNPFAAVEQIDKIEIAAKALKEHPRMGRKGRVATTRELVVAGTRYVLVYKDLSMSTIEIVRVLHGAQQWPPGEARDSRPTRQEDER